MIKNKHSNLFKLVALALTSAFASTQLNAEPQHDGQHKGPPKLSAKDAALSKIIQGRLGDTSTLMGTIAIPASVDTCGDDPGVTRLLCLIDLLKSGVSDKNLTHMQLDYSLEQAKNWSNLPAGAFPARPGVFLGELKVEQRGVVKAILMEAAGLKDNEGFDEMLQTLNADDYIGTISDDYKAGYSSFNSKLAFLGTPAKTGTWELYYGGHHFAFSNTYSDGKLIGATPSFRGIEPFHPFDMNGKTNAPLLQERDTFAAFLKSLTPAQQKAATLEGTYRDIIAGPQADDAIPTEQEGLSVSKLNNTQKALLMKAIATYVEDINATDAKQYMDKYTSEMADTVIGFSGTTALNSEDDYVRVDGPSIWIEFSLQSNKSTNEEGNHPHSVWRDKTDDYGGQTQ